jgi:hypothetical protein
MRVVHKDIFPTELEQGIFYVSREYNTTAHLCASGCGFRVVLPLGKGGWTIGDEQTLTVSPSVHVPKCNSHYWIRNGGIQWARQLSADEIQKFGATDQLEYNIELQKKSLIDKAKALIQRLFKHH